MLPDCHRTHHPLCRSSLCQSDTPCRRTPATVQSGKSHLRPRPHCKQLPGRTLRLSILHASNSFGLAFFLVFLFRKRWLSLFILLWATLNCYTRIYLGVHYPGDLIVGAIIGCCGAAFMCYLLKKTARGASFGKVKHTEITIYVGLLTTIGILIYASIMA